MEAGSGNWPRLTWNLSRKSYAALASVLASSGAAQMGKEKKKVGSLVKPCISEMSKLSKRFIPPLLALQHQVAPSQLPVTSALLPIPNQDEVLQDNIW